MGYVNSNVPHFFVFSCKKIIVFGDCGNKKLAVPLHSISNA